MGDKLDLGPAVYQGILNMTGRGLHLKDASMSGAPGLRGQDQVFNPDTPTADPQSALVMLLMTKYKLDVNNAEAYAAHYMKRSDAEASKLKEEAMEGKRGAFDYPKDVATRTVEGIHDARNAAALQESRMNAARFEAMKANQSARSVGAFVLGGLEKAKYNGMTPATEQVYRADSEAANPYKPPIKPIGEPAPAKKSISVPNGPYGYNYEEEATPQLIPNAPSVPSGPRVPGKLMAPTDPEDYQRWLAALPGGSL